MISAHNIVNTKVDATKPGTIMITKINRPGYVLVRLSANCAGGADIRFVPAGGMLPIDQVTSTGGHLADVVVMPLGRDTELVATRPGGQATYVKFHLTKLQPCNGGVPC